MYIVFARLHGTGQEGSARNSWNTNVSCARSVYGICGIETHLVKAPRCVENLSGVHHARRRSLGSLGQDQTPYKAWHGTFASRHITRHTASWSVQIDNQHADMTAITMTPVAPLPPSTTLPAVRQSAAATVKQLFAFLDAQGHGDYLGEAVSQLEHSLQCAYSAVEAKADHETIIGALLHDVGRFIPQADKMPAMIAPDGKMVGRASHEVLGERYLGQLGFSDKVCQLVGAHVMAKRYLTAVVDGYWESLSPSSKTTLKYQVGVWLAPYPAAQR